MPACFAGLGSETLTITSRPVIIESSTISPSQPEPWGSFLIFEEFFFSGFLLAGSSPSESIFSEYSFEFSEISFSIVVVICFGGVSSSVVSGVRLSPFWASVSLESLLLSEWSGIWSGSPIENIVSYKFFG
jgi:hypothetical protein